MKTPRVLALIIGAVVATAAGLALASNPAGQVVYGPGSPVILTGATVPAPGATSAGGVVVDTVSTLTNGYLLDVRNNGVSKFTVDYTGLAAPAIASTSSTVTTGNVFSIADTSAAQTTATGLAVTQSGTTTGYTGDFVSLTGSSTTGTGNLEKLTCVNTTAGSCETVISNSATTASAGVLALSGTALTSGPLVKGTGGGANMTTGGIVADWEMGAATLGAGVKIVTTGVYTDTAASPFWVVANSATTNTFGTAHIESTAQTTGSTLVIKGGSEANVTTAGRYLSVQDSAGNEQFSVGVDGHQVYAQATAPVVTSTGGSGASCTGCTDTNGKLTITTSASTNVITLTFHTSATPRGCVITPADANTAVDLKAAGGGIVAVGAGTFTITSPSANWAANAKNIYYSCFF